MTEREQAIAALIAAAREVSAATSGKVNREQFAQDARNALAGLDGALARIGKERGE